LTPALLRQGEAKPSHELIILGAGCAGLSLCCHLLDQGVTSPILLLDRRTGYADDRTWCFWNTRPTLFSPLISHAWHRWCVRDNDGHDAVQFQTGSGYSCIQGADFYAYALDQIARHPTVTLRLAETLLDYAEDKHGVAVRTDRGSYRAKFLFDGASPLPAPRRHDVSLRQRFFGQHVQAGPSLILPRRH